VKAFVFHAHGQAGPCFSPAVNGVLGGCGVGAMR
jgi:hypothetical protein